jgi:O-Antigen ligase
MKTATIRTVTPTDVPGALAFPPWLSKAVVGSFLAASFTATWGGLQLGGVQIADIFLLATVPVIAAMVVFGNLRFSIPRWLWPPAVVLLACIAVLQYRPIPGVYLAFRYETAHSILGLPESFGAEHATSDVVKWVTWLVALLAVPVAAVACTALESRVPKWIVAWFLAGVAVSSLIALTDLVNLTHISRSLGYLSIEERQAGFSDHPNTLGLACVLAAPFAVQFIVKSRRRWLPCIALVLLCGGLVACASRGAQAVFPAVVLITIFVSPLKKKGMGWLAATLATATLVGLIFLTRLAPGILGKLFRFGGAGGSASSDSSRSLLRTQAWLDFKYHPIFGIGIKHINEAHCIYLQIISAGGIVLIAGMLIYWFGALRSCWLATRRGETVGLYVMMSIIGWLVIGATENQLTDRFLYYTIGCAAALAATYRVGVETPTGRVAEAVGPR